MTLTDEKWKQIVDLLVQHKIGKCMLHIAVNDCGDTCWIDRKQYEKVKSGKASEDEKKNCMIKFGVIPVDIVKYLQIVKI